MADMMTNEFAMDTMSKFIDHIIDEFSLHSAFTPSRTRLAVIGVTVIEGVVQVDPVKFMLELTSSSGIPIREDVTEAMWDALQGMAKSL